MLNSYSTCVSAILNVSRPNRRAVVCTHATYVGLQQFPRGDQTISSVVLRDRFCGDVVPTRSRLTDALIRV